MNICSFNVSSLELLETEWLLIFCIYSTCLRRGSPCNPLQCSINVIHILAGWKEIRGLLV